MPSWISIVLLAQSVLTAQAVYQNPDLSPEVRAADLVSRMTLEEKVLQMQNTAPAVARLGVPEYDWWNEALHGVARAGLATVFPQAIGLAATWDPDLMNRIADAISTEARAKYHEAIRNGDRSRYHGLTFWSPNINIFRDPRWGRGQETYGEDPFLTSRMAVAFIQGMQGSDPHYFKTIATPKHFAVHSGPEPLRHGFDVRPSARDLDQTYLPAFRASIVEGNAASVMCAYNSIDGVPACANSELLQGRLRDAWRFSGYVVSDCGAITDIQAGHAYMPTLEAASAAAVQAGTDLTCGTEYKTLVQAVKTGLVQETEIDRALARLMVARFRLGMFDPPERVPYSTIPYSQNDSPEHRGLALEATKKSIVLLKNANEILPLRPVIRSIAVIGPAADDPDMLLANYHGTASSVVTPLEGMRHEFDGRAEIRAALGSTYTMQSNVLVSPDALSPGLLAEYFDNADLIGQARLTRLERRVYLNWDTHDPDVVAHIPRDRFSVRWSGSLTAPYTGPYVIGVVRPECDNCTGADSARIYLDDRLIAGENTPATAPRRTQQARVDLQAGRSYALRLEYRQDHSGVGIELVWMPPPAPLLSEALDIVKASDCAVAFVGLNADLEGEEMSVPIPGFAGGDRTSIQLPDPQEQLVRTAIDTGKPVVVVLMSGSALAANYANQHAAAVLEAWYGGEEAGTAIAETLSGANNPSGRLPVTFYASMDDLPPFDDYTMNGRTYRYFKGQPLYRFGYGLSYSNFAYSDLHVSRIGERGGGFQVSARVTNRSARDGDEIVQLYVTPEQNEANPIRQLRAFQRVHLDAGESRTVGFVLSSDTVPPPTRGRGISNRGRTRVSIGGGQPVPGTQYVENLLQLPGLIKR